MKIQRTVTAIKLDSGPELSVEYEWIVLNYGGDLHLMCWERIPEGAPEDAVPDLVLNQPVTSVSDAKYKVIRDAEDNLMNLVRGFSTTRCGLACED